MITKVLDPNAVREMSENISLSQCNEYLAIFTQTKDNLVKVGNRVTTFLQMVTEWGYSSPTDFLIEGGIIPNPNLKRPRTKISDETRLNIVNDLKSGKSTKEISSKYGVTDDAVYNIKGKEHLTKSREKVILVKTEETKDTTVIVPTSPPTNGPTTGDQPTPPPVAPQDQGQIAA